MQHVICLKNSAENVTLESKRFSGSCRASHAASCGIFLFFINTTY
jgi:hypothetical protein